MKARLKYILLIVFIIILGLLSRRTTIIPSLTGDALYATMMFFIVRFCLMKSTTKKVAIISLGICFAIECSQLYQATWINDIRKTLPGRLILGQGFLWNDLPAYVAGVLLGVIIERIFFVH